MNYQEWALVSPRGRRLPMAVGYQTCACGDWIPEGESLCRYCKERGR